MEIDSAITIGSIDVGLTTQLGLARVRQLHVKLALSDVSRRSLPPVMTATGARVPQRITLFDVSATVSVCRLHIDRTLRCIADTSARVLSSVCRTDSESNAGSTTSADDPRLRYVGTLDAGVARLVVCAPCSASNDDFETSGARLLQLSVSNVGIKTRQLHKASLQLEELTVWLVDHDDDDDGDDDDAEALLGSHDFVHRLLYVPRIRWEAVVHYVSKRAGTENESDSDSEDEEDDASASAFAVSFELVFSGKTLSSNTHVPDFGESLLSLHWDHVYPLLVMLCTDDDDDANVDGP
ncbi:hypothetical protein PINS_up010754 [Pythium insidiosum]|nr:hypothetical protein PINS_up010754 [Pythium insidiosum]